MHRIFSALIEIAAASVFIIPLFGIYGKCVVHNWKRTLAYIIFGFYLVAVLALVGFPNVIDMNLEFTINVIPFVGMIADLVNTCLNVLLFVLLGIFLPILWKKYRDIKSTVLAAFGMTVGIEISQIFTYRTTDINDIITNIIGTLVGYLMVKRVTKNFTKNVSESNAKNIDLYIICGAVVLIMFLLQPFISAALWEVMLKR